MPLTLEGHNSALTGLRSVSGYVGLIEAATVVTAIATAATTFTTASLSRTVKAGDFVAFYGAGGTRSSHKVTAVASGTATITPATSFAVPVNSYVGHAPKLGADSVEPTGGAPAYARKALTWLAAGTPTAEALSLDTSAKPTFDVNGGKTIGGFLIATAISAGTINGTFLTNSMESFGSQGTYQLTDAKVTLAS